METTTTLIKEKVIEELRKAENIWNEVKSDLIKGMSEHFEMGSETVSTKIPGFATVTEGKPKVGNFIALVLDIRGSTRHLVEAISEKTAKASQLQRVFYETTAINAAGSLIIESKDGGITEFLGDGFLAFFSVEDELSPKKEVHSAYNAAKECVSATSNIINPILKDRYNLPPLNIGIGLAYSKAIVTLVGSENNLHPKAIGECVYRASKLSGSPNIDGIWIDEPLKIMWPKGEKGQVKFLPLNSGHKFPAYNVFKPSFINK